MIENRTSYCQRKSTLLFIRFQNENVNANASVTLFFLCYTCMDI